MSMSRDSAGPALASEVSFRDADVGNRIDEATAASARITDEGVAAAFEAAAVDLLTAGSPEAIFESLAQALPALTSADAIVIDILRGTLEPGMVHSCKEDTAAVVLRLLKRARGTDVRPEDAAMWNQTEPAGSPWGRHALLAVRGQGVVFANVGLSWHDQRGCSLSTWILAQRLADTAGEVLTTLSPEAEMPLAPEQPGIAATSGGSMNPIGMPRGSVRAVGGTPVAGKAELAERLAACAQSRKAGGPDYALLAMRLQPVSEPDGVETDASRVLVDLLADSIRDTDTVSELSGREFALLLQDVELQAVPAVMRRLHSAVSQSAALSGWKLYMARLEPSESSPGELLHRAREAAMRLLVQAAAATI